ncbi:MAG: HlyD family efflux transporter periplasmic adaptor subunit [Erysipelotrichaceae bacterium]|nr:HlyD family efflux transporter periplasmic adaptor subunit [Erysipelotrichaceae bacterium]MDY5251147.1 HlyD family efflux transporter periplasmic adaptor subunit [Erysipelotrichaceae bacterium]
MLKNNLKKIGIAVIVVVLIISGAMIFTSQKGGNKDNENEKYVRTVTLSKGSLDETVSTSGIVASTSLSTITTNLTNPIKTVNVAVGDQVKAGDVIITLDSEDIVNQINKAKATLDENIAKANEAYQNAVAEKEKRYGEMKNAENEHNAKLSAYNSAKSNFDIAASTVNSYQNNYNNAKSAMEASGQNLNSAQTAYENKKNEEGGNCTSDACKALENSYNEANKQYEEKKAALEAAQKDLDEAKSRTNYDSYLASYNSANEQYQIAKTAFEQAQQVFSTADANVINAQNNIEKSKTSDELNTLNEQLANCTLKAQTDGTITSLNATVGGKPLETLATIQDTQKLKVNITIEEYDMQKVKEGMKCIITSDATTEPMEGRLVQLSPVATPNNNGGNASTFTGEVEIINPHKDLLIGMNAKVQIVISSLDNVFSVPLDAIEEKEDGTYVIYVQNEQTKEFEPVSVTKGEENDYYAQISGDSLKEGMVVRASAVESEAMEQFGEGMMEGTIDESYAVEAIGGPQ